MLVVFCFFKEYNNSRLDLKSVDLLLLFFLPGFTFSITCAKIKMKNSGRMHTYRQFKSLRWRRIRFCFVCSFVLGQRKRSILIVKYLFGSGNFAIQVSPVVRMEPVVYILSFISSSLQVSFWLHRKVLREACTNFTSIQTWLSSEMFERGHMCVARRKTKVQVSMTTGDDHW